MRIFIGIFGILFAIFGGGCFRSAARNAGVPGEVASFASLVVGIAIAGWGFSTLGGE